ncbi:glycosyltransferase family 2 protein [Erythrobacter sp.]|uniref:glycosyltransferase family 2 protein n=1 Tax=Erythrobacter sp. TaxID=1042 RepID=UPI002E997235|nr:glycosyltransferase family 2 protein [Erythrobacter sp.]
MTTFVPEPEQSPALSIFIVAYNSAALISACLGSIPDACRSHSYEVLLIDQGDGSTRALVEHEVPHIRIVEDAGNIGFAGGNNLLAAEARGEMFLLLNPDVVLLPGAIDALFAASERYPEASAWGGVTLNREGEPDNGNSVRFPSLSEMASRVRGRSSARFDSSAVLACDQQVQSLSGSFAMIRADAWREVGGFDESYFLYSEEVDLFYRLRSAGHDIWRISSARAIHDIGHGNVHSRERILFRAAGMMQFVRTHWPWWKREVAFVLLWLAAIERWAFAKVLGRLFPSARAVGEGHTAMARFPSRWRQGYRTDRGIGAELSDWRARRLGGTIEDRGAPGE